MFKIVLKWIFFWPIGLFFVLLTYIAAPFVSFFVQKEEREDRVKRLGNEQVKMQREYLHKWVRWLQTHDNALDEWWYGLFNTEHWFKFARDWVQLNYDYCVLTRYYCRVCWLWRNPGYGLRYHIIGVNWDGKTLYEKVIGNRKVKEFALVYRNFNGKAFQLRIQIPIYFTEYFLNTNIGWKPHDGFPKLMYAGQLLSLKKY